MLTQRLCLKPAVAERETPSAGGGGPVGDVAWSTAPAADTVLDELALQRLRDLDPTGENQLLARVIQAFQTSAARLLPQLQEARRGGDWAAVRHVAHTLKSSSASIGAIKLSQLCAEIETRIRTDKLENVDPRVDAMGIEVEIVLQALQRLLDATP
jgi:HPt (histidine-containing phosphotransfer) domain-containing protein